MTQCACGTSFAGWFYANPECWADPIVIARFRESIKVRQAYIEDLGGELGERIRALHSRWVAGSGEALLRGARLKAVELKNASEDAKSNALDAVVSLDSRSDARIRVLYVGAHVSMLGSVLMGESEVVIVASHEFKLCCCGPDPKVVHFIFVQSGLGNCTVRIIAQSVYVETGDPRV